MNKSMEHDEVQQLADVHAALVQQFLNAGYLPGMQHLASSLEITPQELTGRLNALADLHGLVLHPHAAEPWVVHPFSTTPTLHYVEGQKHGWWAPCIWCALGIAQLAGGEVRIHTRIGAETEPTILKVRDGVPLPADEIYVHGEAVTLEATASLARRWYGPYSQSSWRKWTVEQAQQIFLDSGLTSHFWELSGKGTY